MPDLPERPSLEFLRKQAKARARTHQIALSRAQLEPAREYGFASWPKLVQRVRLAGLQGIERALVPADPAALAALLTADAAAAQEPFDGLAPLLMLLRRSTGSPPAVRVTADVGRTDTAISEVTTQCRSRSTCHPLLAMATCGIR
jgi:hypothetical protein